VGDAVNVTDVPAHIVLDGDAAILTAGVNTEFTTIVMVFDVAVTGLAQVALEIISHVIKSLFARLPFT
jgi:hypothetical protein